MDQRSLASRWLVWFLAALAVAVAAHAFLQASRFYGHPIAGGLVDANAVISSVGPSNWPARQLGLGFPDRVVEVDGFSLRLESGATRADRYDKAVTHAAKAGQRTLPVRVETESGLRDVELPILPLDGIAWWLLSVVLFFAGALYVMAGLVALWVNPAGSLARTWAMLTTFSGLFLFTLFDFHTSRTMVPLFYLSLAMVPVGLVVLPLRLPDDIGVLARHRWLEGALVLVGLLGALACIVPWSRGESSTGVQQTLARALGASLFFFVIVFLVRFVRARGVRRSILRALLLALVPPLAILSISQFPDLRGSWAWTTDLVTYPALSLPPLATAYAFVRHDLWGSRAVLSRILTNVLVIAVVGALSVGLGTALSAELGAPLPAALAGAAAAGIVAAIAVAAALAVVERRLFPARAHYKPTIEQLSEELINITSPEQVARAIEHNVERWLPCEHVELELEPVPAAVADSARSARRLVPANALALDGELALPVTFGGERLGLLRLGRKRGGALYSHDDLDLLHTIVNQGALALAHAHAYRELEVRRRQQAAAWRGEREALVETVAAEIAHEVRYPLNFFRTSFERLARGAPLEAEDVDIGREEIDRLERMVAGLRRMAAHRMQRKHTVLYEICSRAEVLLRDSLGERRIHIDADPQIELRCDPDQVTQILVNLLSNAMDAVGPQGQVGIELGRDEKGAELRVWDDGPGFVGEASRLFVPWYTTKERGTGLGLAITLRLVRAHGWNIAAARRANLTVFSVGIPASDVRAGQSGAEARANVA